MTEAKKHRVLTIVMVVFLFAVSVICWLKPAQDFSTSERRLLKQFPVLSVNTVLSGKFMSDFESYALDQFPARDSLRTVKALSSKYLYAQKNNNDIYSVDGYLSKLEYPLKESAADRAADLFRSIYERYFADAGSSVYYSVIPDKNYFLAADNGYPAMDYSAMLERLYAGLDEFTYIDIFPLLQLEDYYRTDTHWDQQSITEVAQTLVEGMGGQWNGQYYANILERDFYGVYAGQSALPVKPDTLTYLTWEGMDRCEVFDHENNREIGIYDMEKAAGEDPYEMFLSGSISLITIDNPDSNSNKELVIFRDSFGSSIAPLLVESYAKITLVDIRYLPSARLGDLLEFNGQDVLFLYSTGVLNNSETMK